MATGKVTLEHINEAINRASSNGRLGVLRVFVSYGGEKAISSNNRKDKILAECDGGDGQKKNGPCYRYLKLVLDGRAPSSISHNEVNLFDDPNELDIGGSGRGLSFSSNDPMAMQGSAAPRGCCAVS